MAHPQSPTHHRGDAMSLDASPARWPDALEEDLKGQHRLSVIIPARDEEEQIGNVLRHALRTNVWEVIVVDGQSTDRTAEVARSFGATLVPSLPGRGVQMNTGAATATGDVFLFLHADTRVPLDYDREVFRTLASPGVTAGAFGLRIDAPNRSLGIIEKLTNWRSRFLQMPYGDQGVFLKRETFCRVGGFPDFPVLEDFELVRRLRLLARIQIADVSVVTSARRWLHCGVWRTTLLNQAWIAAYYLGVPPRLIAAWRQSSGRRAADRSGPTSGTAPDDRLDDKSRTAGVITVSA